MMRVALHIDPLLKHHKEYGDLFVAGLKKHKVAVQVQRGFIPTECDIAVVWSRHKRAQKVIEHQEKNNRQVVILEGSHFGYPKSSAASVSVMGQGLLRDPSVYRSDLPGDRFEQFKAMMKPWKPGKTDVVVVGQVANDQMIGAINMRGWVYEQLTAIKEAGHKVVYMPDPHDNGYQRVPAKVETVRDDLQAALKKAKCVVVYDSLVGVESMFAGVPVIVLIPDAPHAPHAAVWPVAGTSLAYLEDLKDLIEPTDREQWANWLAYSQWSREEIENGSMWAYLAGIAQEAKAQNDAHKKGANS